MDVKYTCEAPFLFTHIALVSMCKHVMTSTLHQTLSNSALARVRQGRVPFCWLREAGAASCVSGRSGDEGN